MPALKGCAADNECGAGSCCMYQALTSNAPDSTATVDLNAVGLSTGATGAKYCVAQTTL